jgi:6-phosphogluconate dehydrogenase (decarboxylating)
MAMDVGFVGLGSMGAAMVPNLVKAGHRVSVWNRAVAAAKALDGVTVLPSAQLGVLRMDTVGYSEGAAKAPWCIQGCPGWPSKACLSQ